MNDEAFRPTYHYTPRRHFMNDPNGLTYLDGQFFLFHQFNPHGDRWGHISWKQAVSSDLVNWTHLPVALSEEDGVMAFSGSAVVDTNNDSGLGRPGAPAILAFYTGHRVADRRESQCLAYSADTGKTWVKFADNPVLPYEADFRDPKVFRHEETNRWIMVVAKAAEKKIRFYASADLRSWEYLSDFGPEGVPAATIPNWECPDLFALPIEGGEGESRWVLHISVGDGHPNGGSGGQYFIGHFDGTRFVNDNPTDTVLWSDFGKDNYAAVSWSGIAGERGEKYWAGWMCNWQYAEAAPTYPWRNGLTLPRLLSLRHTKDGLRLVQNPIPQLNALRTEQRSFDAVPLNTSSPFTLSDAGVAYEIEAEFDLGTAHECGFGIRVGENERTIVGIDTIARQVFIDRSQSGVLCSPHFPGRHAAPLPDFEGRIRLRIFVDAGSVEVFIGDGLLVMTELIFPCAESQAFFAYATGGAARLTELTLWKLNPATVIYKDGETFDDENKNNA